MKKSNKALFSVILLTAVIIAVSLSINHFQGSRRVNIKGILNSDIKEVDNNLILLQSLSNDCFAYEYGSNITILNARYFYRQNGNNVSVYRKENNNCQLAVSFVSAKNIVQAKEFTDLLVLASDNQLYVIKNDNVYSFGPYPMVSDFNMVDNSIIFASNYDDNIRVNTLTIINENMQEKQVNQESNNARFDTILVNDSNVIISYISDFLQTNPVSFYSNRLDNTIDNIISNRPNFTKSKILTDTDSESAYVNINRLPYFGSKQLQCQENLRTCAYLENEVLAFNDNYSIIKTENNVALLNKKNNQYMIIGTKQYRYDLDENNLYIIDGNNIRIYGI